MSPASTPAGLGYRMPAEWHRHAATWLTWPKDPVTWPDRVPAVQEIFLQFIDALTPHERVCLLVDNADVAADVRRRCQGRAARLEHLQLIEIETVDSWIRDYGPNFLLGPEGQLAFNHWGFNAWGGKYELLMRDASVPARLGLLADVTKFEPGLVLEGGSIDVNGAGTVLTTEQCLLHPNRNPHMTREEIERGLCDFLGVERVVWLGQGLVEDKDTDGHVDLIAAFAKPGEVLLQSTPLGTPSSERMADNRSRLVAAGLEVVDFPILPALEVGGEAVSVSHMNFYLCNGGAVVPVAGAPTDAEALERIGAAYPDREVVGVPGGVIAFGGGGPHCITQQVPAASA